jgi:hypothetical protein
MAVAGLLPADPEEECLSEVTAGLTKLPFYSTEPGQWWGFYLQALRKCASMR